MNVKLQTMNSKKMKQIVHVSRLQKYVTPNKPTNESDLLDTDDFDWELEVGQLKEPNQQQTTLSAKSDNMEVKFREKHEREYEVQSILNIRKENGE